MFTYWLLSWIIFPKILDIFGIRLVEACIKWQVYTVGGFGPNIMTFGHRKELYVLMHPLQNDLLLFDGRSGLTAYVWEAGASAGNFSLEEATQLPYPIYG